MRLTIDPDLAILVLGRIAQTLLSLVALRALTSILSVEEVGHYYLLLAIGFFFSYILMNPIAMYFSRHLVEWKAKNLVLPAYKLFCCAVTLAAFGSIVIASLLYVLLDYTENFSFIEFTFVLFCIASLSVIHRNTLTGINILISRKIFILLLVLTLALGLAGSVAFILHLEASAIHWFYGVIFAEIVTFPFLIKYFSSQFPRSRGEWRTEASFHYAEFSRFCLPIVGTNVFLWSQLYLYRLIVDERYGEEALGMIGVAIAVAAATFAAIENIISQYFYPVYIKKIYNVTNLERANAWNSMASQVVPIYILLACFLIANAKSMMVLLADEKFHDAYILTMIAVGVEFFRVMSNLLNYIFQAEYKTSLAVLPYFFGVTFIVLNLVGFDFEGAIEWVVCVLLVGNALVFAFMLFNAGRVMKIQINMKVKKLILLMLPFLVYIFAPKINLTFLQDLLVVAAFGVYLLASLYFYNLRERIVLN